MKHWFHYCPSFLYEERDGDRRGKATALGVGQQAIQIPAGRMSCGLQLILCQVVHGASASISSIFGFPVSLVTTGQKLIRS